MERNEENELIQKGNELLSERRGINSDILDDIRGLTNALQDQLKTVSFQKQEKREIISLSRSISKISQQNYTILEKELGTTKLLKTIENDKLKLEKEIKSIKDLSSKNLTDDVELNHNIKITLDEMVLSSKKLNAELSYLKLTTEGISKDLGIKTFGALSDITKTIPGLSRFSTPFKEAEEAARKQVITNQKLNALQDINLQTGSGLNKEKIKQLGLEDKLLGKNGDILTGSSAIQKLKKDGNLEALQALQSQGKSMSSLIAGAKSLGPALAKAFGPAYILFELVQAFLKLDKLAGDTAKSMGISYSQATKLNSEFNSIANSSGNIFVTTKGINESFNQINQSLGTNGQLSKELLVTQTELVKQAFYSVEAATTLSKLSLATGKPAKEITTQFLGQAKALNLVNNTAINEKQLLESISKVSKATLATFASQPKELAKAAFEAKKLGLELSQIEAIQTSLLSIESSIAAEFEAEVITGKQLNLERARYFALTNNISELSKELANQGITQAEFAGMNVIQQEAVAQAMGMSRDIMGGMLLEQSAISKLSQIDGDTAKEKYKNAVKLHGVEKANAMLGEKTLIDQMQSASMQDKFLQSVEKLKEAFVGLMQPLMPILDIFSTIITYIAQSETALLALQTVITGLAVKSLITAIASIFTGSAILGPVGLGIAAAATAGLMIAVNTAKSVGDISSPSSGKTQVSTKEGGLFELSKNDDLVAAPGLINKLNSPTQPLIVNQPTPTPPPQIDYDKMAQALSKIQVQTNIDGVKISSELQKAPMGMAIRKI
jgi:hypothetical protein